MTREQAQAFIEVYAQVVDSPIKITDIDPAIEEIELEYFGGGVHTKQWYTYEEAIDILTDECH